MKPSLTWNLNGKRMKQVIHTSHSHAMKASGGPVGPGPPRSDVLCFTPRDLPLFLLRAWRSLMFAIRYDRQWEFSSQELVSLASFRILSSSFPVDPCAILLIFLGLKSKVCVDHRVVLPFLMY
ncbi:hypothetical protein BHE74_00020572 [Ensete ventricosum]|nr:hypothetical protein BHE74_00020572 [Ensete ventricosum]